MDPVLRGDGVLEWLDAQGRPHRTDGPARVFPGGRREWYRHGSLHREGGPAVEHANGSVKWYRDGRRHRDGAPACVYVNGTEKWYRDGLRHRDDGPAAIYPDGRRIWFVEGLHAVTGEPHLVALEAQRAPQHLCDVAVVLDHEHPGLRCGHRDDVTTEGAI